jgi:hypothetical protein
LSELRPSVSARLDALKYNINLKKKKLNKLLKIL